MTQNICPVCNWNEVETKVVKKVDSHGNKLDVSVEVDCCNKCAEWIKQRNTLQGV